MPGGKDRCFVVDCFDQHVSMHVLPAEANRTKWLRFIFDGKVPSPGSLPKKIVVCANHFTTDCFENYRQYTAGFALRLRLKKGSVPTIRFKFEDDGDVSTA